MRKSAVQRIASKKRQPSGRFKKITFQEAKKLSLALERRAERITRNAENISGNVYHGSKEATGDISNRSSETILSINKKGLLKEKSLVHDASGKPLIYMTKSPKTAVSFSRRMQEGNVVFQIESEKIKGIKMHRDKNDSIISTKNIPSEAIKKTFILFPRKIAKKTIEEIHNSGRRAMGEEVIKSKHFENHLTHSGKVFKNVNEMICFLREKALEEQGSRFADEVLDPILKKNGKVSFEFLEKEAVKGGVDHDAASEFVGALLIAPKGEFGKSGLSYHVKNGVVFLKKK